MSSKADTTESSLKARSRRESLRPIVALLGPHRRWLTRAIGFGLFAEILIISGVAISAYLVGQALTGAAATELWPWIISLTIVVPAIVVCQQLDVYYAHKSSFLSHDDIRQNLFDAFERLAPAFFVHRRSGDATSAATSDVELIELYSSHHVPNRVVATAIPTLAAIGLFVIHPLLGLALLPFLLLVTSVPSWLRTRSSAQGQEILDRSAVLSADVVDVVGGLREIAAFGAEDFQQERMNRNAGRLTRARVAHGRRAGFEKGVTDGLVGLGLLAVVGVAALLVSNNELGAGGYLAAVVLTAAAFLPIARVTGVGRELNRVAAAADRITDILAEQPAVRDDPEARRATDVLPEIRFDRVSFRYAPDLPDALHDINFAVAPGETVALVGHSGAGKSTCANLLLRLWDPTSGAVRIGGRDLRTLPLAQIADLVAYVPQDVYLFNGSVWENIRVGRPGFADDDIRRAAATAQAAEFIEALPRGYDTELGERGARLSGGQRQRIAIARAVLSPAPILIMDEAVSNLDAESEIALHHAISDLAEERTVLIIAHRPSTIRTADRIVVLDNGHVVDEGRFADLTRTDGPFATLLHRGFDKPS